MSNRLKMTRTIDTAATLLGASAVLGALLPASVVVAPAAAIALTVWRVGWGASFAAAMAMDAIDSYKELKADLAKVKAMKDLEEALAEEELAAGAQRVRTAAKKSKIDDAEVVS